MTRKQKDTTRHSWWNLNEVWVLEGSIGFPLFGMLYAGVCRQVFLGWTEYLLESWAASWLQFALKWFWKTQGEGTLECVRPHTHGKCGKRLKLDNLGKRTWEFFVLFLQLSLGLKLFQNKLFSKLFKEAEEGFKRKIKDTYIPKGHVWFFFLKLGLLHSTQSTYREQSLITSVYLII